MDKKQTLELASSKTLSDFLDAFLIRCPTYEVDSTGEYTTMLLPIGDERVQGTSRNPSRRW